MCFVYNVQDIYRHGILEAESLWQPLWFIWYLLNTISLSALIVVCSGSTLQVPVKTIALLSRALVYSSLFCLANGIMYWHRLYWKKQPIKHSCWISFLWLLLPLLVIFQWGVAVVVN